MHVIMLGSTTAVRNFLDKNPSEVRPVWIWCLEIEMAHLILVSHFVIIHFAGKYEVAWKVTSSCCHCRRAG